ncbi:MAG: flagellar basal body rod protein FlgB [Magnetococcales bacterium]|nr:flagellar basal body rod protein FlgB [Magnetococcales bacterium]
MSDYGLLGQTGAFKANLLNLRQRRQDIIAANVANADTPGYKAKRIDFEDEMLRAFPPPDQLKMARTSGNHIPIPFGTPVAGEVQAVETSIPKGDKNSVDLEQEMARQTANQLLYNYATQSLNGQINTMRMMIDGQAR